MATEQVQQDRADAHQCADSATLFAFGPLFVDGDAEQQDYQYRTQRAKVDQRSHAAILPLPGMETLIDEQDRSAEEVAGELMRRQIEATLRTPIRAEAAVGYVERQSALFVDSPANPQASLFAEPEPAGMWWDKHLHRAIHGYANAGTRWEERREPGMTNEELLEAARFEMGIGGCCDFDTRGDKFYVHDPETGRMPSKPTLQGQSTVAAIRRIMAIGFPGKTARNPKTVKPAAPQKELAKITAELTAATLTLEEATSNLAEVVSHERAHQHGIVDANWWQGGMQFGCLDAEFYTGREDGHYPIKARRWLRHLRFDLHKQVRDARAAVAEITERHTATRLKVSGPQSNSTEAAPLTNPIAEPTQDEQPTAPLPTEHEHHHALASWESEGGRPQPCEE
jgi:hypothetical protein